MKNQVNKVSIYEIITIFNLYGLETLKEFLRNIHIINQYSWSYKLQQMVDNASDIAILYELYRVSLNLNIDIK